MKHKISNTDLLLCYSDMLLLRKFEERCSQIYGMGKIGGFCHLYIGQEALAVATYLAITKNDYVITTYRCHGQAILSGIEPKHVLAELMGKKTGCSKGKGGSMHLFNKEGRFYGGHGIVGGSVPLGTGIGFAAKYRNTQDICVTFLGDGAVNQGQVYESFNMAALWKIPVLYIIENNEYSMGTSVERSSFVTDLYKKGESFGIEGRQVDGMDLFKVYDAVKELSDRVRKTAKPLLLEVKTYRYKGHSMSDPAKYRTKQEVAKYKVDDPIKHIKAYLVSNNIATESQLKDIDDKVKSMMLEAVDFAENSAKPSADELMTDIYKDSE